MRVDHLRRVYDYNYWANEKLLGVVKQLTPQEFTRSVAGSYGSIRTTLVHVLSAEWGRPEAAVATWRPSAPRACARGASSRASCASAAGPRVHARQLRLAVLCWRDWTRASSSGLAPQGAMTVPTKHSLIAPAIGLLVGLGIGYVDSRPTWDDAGITAGALFLAAAVLAAARPKLFWLTGLAVGLPVLAMNALLHSNYGSAIAVGFSLVGSAVGHVAGKILGFTRNHTADRP